MISTKNLLHHIGDVPNTWIFEFYCGLKEKLEGQDVWITSLFNPDEKTPSMHLFFNVETRQYAFKDFSTSRGGNAARLVRELLSLETGVPVSAITYGAAMDKITKDYNSYLLGNGTYTLGEFKVRARYKVTDFCARKWNNLDARYWQSFHIGSRMLDHYKVVPLEFYKMERDEEGELKELYISGQYIYGYFRMDNSLYKIYQPKVLDNKFIKVRDYVQGTDQLTYTKSTLVIASSLKDGMALMGLGYKDLEFVAPDSENTTIRKETLNVYKYKYPYVFTLFDNDQAGVAAAARYHSTQGIAPLSLAIEKDLSDSIKAHGRDMVKSELNVQFSKYGLVL